MPSDSFASAVLDKIFLAYQNPLFGNIYIKVLNLYASPMDHSTSPRLSDSTIVIPAVIVVD